MRSRCAAENKPKRRSNPLRARHRPPLSDLRGLSQSPGHLHRQGLSHPCEPRDLIIRHLINTTCIYHSLSPVLHITQEAKNVDDCDPCQHPAHTVNMHIHRLMKLPNRSAWLITNTPKHVLKIETDRCHDELVRRIPLVDHIRVIDNVSAEQYTRPSGVEHVHCPAPGNEYPNKTGHHCQIVYISLSARLKSRHVHNPKRPAKRNGPIPEKSH